MENPKELEEMGFQNIGLYNVFEEVVFWPGNLLG